jgi:hypothetical protein
MSKRFSLAKVQAAENFNRWNKSRIWKNTGTFVRKVHSNWKRIELGSDHVERMTIKDLC